MSAKPLALAFAAGVGLTAVVLTGVWTWNGRGGPSEGNEVGLSPVAALPVGAVEETEAVVAFDPGPATPTPERAPDAARVDEPRPPARQLSAPAAASARAPVSPARPAPAPAEPVPTASAEPGEPAQPAQQARSTSPAPQAQHEAASEPLSPVPSVPAMDDDWPDAASNPDESLADRYPIWNASEPIFDELVIAEDSVISLEINTTVSTEFARVEDRVEARTIRDVKVGGETVIPAGAVAIGSVTLVEPGGKVKERARLGVRFHTIELSDGSDVAVRTETIYREGRSPARGSAARIGGAATAGAILGAIFGGRRGAVIGGAAGAAGGTAATMATDREPATLPAGTSVTIRLTEPTTVTVER